MAFVASEGGLVSSHTRRSAATEVARDGNHPWIRNAAELGSVVAIAASPHRSKDFTRAGDRDR